MLTIKDGDRIPRTGFQGCLAGPPGEVTAPSMTWQNPGRNFASCNYVPLLTAGRTLTSKSYIAILETKHTPLLRLRVWAGWASENAGLFLTSRFRVLELEPADPRAQTVQEF